MLILCILCVSLLSVAVMDENNKVTSDDESNPPTTDILTMSTHYTPIEATTSDILKTSISSENGLLSSMMVVSTVEVVVTTSLVTSSNIPSSKWSLLSILYLSPSLFFSLLVLFCFPYFLSLSLLVSFFLLSLFF